MAKALWYHYARVGAVVWLILVFVIIYSYHTELAELEAVPNLAITEEEDEGKPTPPFSDASQAKNDVVLWQKEREIRIEMEIVKLKWVKMALLIFVLLVLLPLALCVIEKEEKQKSHAVAHLWKWTKSSFLSSTVLYCLVLVLSFSLRDLFPDEEEGRGILIAPTGGAGPQKEIESLEDPADAKGEMLAFRLLRWGLGLMLVAPFIGFTFLVAYLGYLRFTERSFLCGRGKDLCVRWWGALSSPEEVSRDISMMGMPLLVICTEVSLYDSHKLLPGQQLILLSSALSLCISGFIVPVITSLIAKGAVCHSLQFKDKDNDSENVDAEEDGYTSKFEAMSKACAAGIVICVPLTLFSAMLSMPFLRIHRSIIILLSTIKSWITSLAAGGLGLVQFNLRRSLVMGDRVSQILLITSSLSLFCIMVLSLFFYGIDDVNSFDFSKTLSATTRPTTATSIDVMGRSEDSETDSFNNHPIPSAMLIAAVDSVYVFGFSLTALFAFNRIKYL